MEPLLLAVMLTAVLLLPGHMSSCLAFSFITPRDRTKNHLFVF